MVRSPSSSSLSRRSVLARLPGFFWLAGQGGYGIQTSPGMARIAGSLARGQALPADIQDRGLDAADLSPDRLSLET